MNSHPTPKEHSLFNFVCSGIAGFSASIIDYPLGIAVDRVVAYKGKIRSVDQLQRAAFAESYTQNIYARWHSLYRGFWIGELRRLGKRTFKYGFQPIVANTLASGVNLDEENEPTKKVLIEGAAGGVTKLILHYMFYGFGTIRVKQQNGVNDPVLAIIKNEGLKLYKGHELELVNKVSSATILFSVTSLFLRMFNVRNENEANFWQFAIASNVATLMSVLSCYPMTVVQERLQLTTPANVSTFGMFSRIARNEGMAGLYKGATAKVITAFPEKALPLAITNWLMATWKVANRDEDHHHEARRPMR